MPISRSGMAVGRSRKPIRCWNCRRNASGSPIRQATAASTRRPIGSFGRWRGSTRPPRSSGGTGNGSFRPPDCHSIRVPACAAATICTNRWCKRPCMPARAPPASTNRSDRTSCATASPRTSSRMAMTSASCRSLLGHRDVATTMIYTHVLNRGGRAVESPADPYSRRPLRAIARQNRRPIPSTIRRRRGTKRLIRRSNQPMMRR